MGRSLVERMFAMNPEVTDWEISAISGRMSALFWYATASRCARTIHSAQYGEICRASSRRFVLQWPAEAWQYWLLPASFNDVRPDIDEKDSFAGDDNYPFDGPLYSAILLSYYRVLSDSATIEAISEVECKIALVPRKHDDCMDNTLSMVRSSMTLPPSIDPRSGYVRDGIHRLSASRAHGVTAVVTTDATAVIEEFLRCEDPATVYYSTPERALDQLRNIIDWWESKSPPEVRALNVKYVARLHEARSLMVRKYGV